MKLYPMPTEAAEIAHDLDYRDCVQTPAEFDEAYDEAASDPAKLARKLIECDDDAPIIKMLKLLMEANTIRCGAGPMHDDYRRKLVGKMMDVHHELCKAYAEAA